MDLDLTVRYLDDLTALNVTLPAKTVAAADTYREALATASLSPATELQASVLAGTVTTENVAEMVRSAALAQAAQQHAHQIVRDLHTTFNKAIRDGLREDFDRIHKELRATFDPAAAKVTDAAKHFGPETTAEQIVTAKPEIVKQWNQLKAHASTLEAVSGAYRRLLSDITRELPDNIASLFVTGTVDLHQASELYRERHRWLALAHAGFALRLNSPKEAAEVVAQAEEVARQQAEAERQVNLKAHRFRHRFDLRAAGR